MTEEMSSERHVLIGLLTVVCLLQYDVMAGVVVRPCPTQCVCSQLAQWHSLDIGLNIYCHKRPGNDSQQLYSQIDSLLMRNLHQNLDSLIIEYAPLVHLPRSLCRLTTLKSVDILSTHLADLPNNCFINFDRLEKLHLNSNNITNLPNSLFDGISQLVDFRLIKNPIAELPNGIFDNMSYLTSLALIDNKIANLPQGVFNGVGKLDFLDLSGNKINKLPKGVFGGMVQLDMLQLGRNQIDDLADGVFDGMDRLRVLDLRYNKITNLQNGVFDGIGRLECLNLRSNRITNLANGVFNGMGKLIILDLSGNKITELSNGVFHGIGQLIEIDLSHNQIVELSNGVFDGMRALSSLTLTGNQIASISRDVFSSKSNMSIQMDYLYLDDNHLTSLEPWWHDVNTKHMRVSKNPWDCSCDNKWMSGWLNSIAGQLDDIKDVLCYTPPRFQRKIMIHLSDEEFCENPAAEASKTTWIVSMSSVAGVVIVLLFVGVIVYRLRVKLYTRWKSHPFDRDECLGEDMDYDVFFCCSSKDDEPKGRRMVETLEAQGYSVCYHYRDFMPGLIMANIEASVRRSKRTLCLLTSNFLCRFANVFYHHRFSCFFFYFVYFTFDCCIINYCVKTRSSAVADAAR